DESVGRGVDLCHESNVPLQGFFQTPLANRESKAIDCRWPGLVRDQVMAVSLTGMAGSVRRETSTGAADAMRRRPWSMSRGRPTVKIATRRSPSSQHADQVGSAGSPRHSRLSAPPWWPTYGSMRPNCSDQKYGTGS